MSIGLPEDRKFVARFWGLVDQADQLSPPQFPIYVPSRGRAGNAPTLTSLDRSGIPHTVVVEPQDFTDYRRTAPPSASLLVLDENDRGLAYVRNTIKQHAAAAGHPWHWQLDDDIRRFMVRRDGKNHPVPARTALALIEASIAGYMGIGGAGIPHEIYAWREKQDVRFNRGIYTAVLLATDTAARWRPDLVDDVDYTLQLLAAGLCTILFNRVFYASRTQGAQSGGLRSPGNCTRTVGVINTQAQWPGAFPRLKDAPDGKRLGPSPVWAAFRQRPRATAEVTR